MDNFNNPVADVEEEKMEEEKMDDENTTVSIQSEVEKVLGGTLEGAFELRGGMGLLVTIKKDNKPYALVIQRPVNGFDPKKDTDVYITEGMGK
ncbi:MAG: hypothetical protein GF404_00145 [candidate division Zixibacteria bacterium]|jgi:hypothetical protein|nr:hypothetical protein [candidate division Zixibacteria bacterium]